MKTKPFNTPDVQAILAGRKTMFREVIKPQPDGITANNKPYLKKFVDIWDTETNDIVHTDKYNGHQIVNPINHRFQINDIIAVKETWTKTMVRDEKGWFYVYKADGDDWAAPFSSPVIMPAEAHRIFLEVVSVKVERLQDISEGDVIAEGIEEFTKDNTVYKYGIDGWDWSTMPRTPKEAYQRLYNIHPDKWQRNEWVFVYGFRRVEKP